MNIDHSQDDISKADGEAPTLGGFSVSRGVMTTGSATATYWTKLCDFTCTSSGTGRLNVNLRINGSDGQTTGDASLFGDVSLYIVETVADGLVAATSDISVISLNGPYLNHNGFMLTQATAAAGQTISLWMQSNRTATVYSITEIAASGSGEPFTIDYNTDSTWQSAIPTGAVTLTSDWAGSGQLTSTSFQNGWAGTAYYEKSADGLVLFKFNITTVGTTTDGTTIFTLPAGYRPNNYFHAMVTGAAGTDGAAGYVVVTAAGLVNITDFNTAVTTPVLQPVTFVARN